MLVDLDRFGRVSVQSLSGFVDSAGLLVSGVYQCLADFHMLPLGTCFPSLQPDVFWYLFLHPHTHTCRAIHTNSHRGGFYDMLFSFSLVKYVILLVFLPVLAG